jgi:nucleoside-diphosphate-sugar epimerase
MGCEVRVLDDLSTGLRENLAHVADDVELVRGDIRDFDCCERVCEGVSWVFHQAALGSVPRSVEDPETTHAVNVTGTVNMLRAARSKGAERFVFAASSAAYGDTVTLPKVETMRPRPLSPYAASKLACEHYLASFNAVYDMATVSLRYFNIFGPRQRPDGPYAAVIPVFFDRLSNGVAPTIFGDGEQTRDFTFVDNAVEANILAATNAKPEAYGQVLNVAVGERISLNLLYREIAALTGCDDDPVYTETRAGDVRDSLADISRIKDLLGYEVTVDLAEGLRRTWEAYGG